MLTTHPLLQPRIRRRSYTSCHPNAPVERNGTTFTFTQNGDTDGEDRRQKKNVLTMYFFGTFKEGSKTFRNANYNTEYPKSTTK
jgi:hypothetical protein